MSLSEPEEARTVSALARLLAAAVQRREASAPRDQRPDRMAQSAAEGPLGAAPARRRTGTILVVDDDRAVREMLAELLRHRGYTVETAGNGRNAFEYLRDHPQPSLIVVDLMMPVMNGWVFINELREDPSFASIPVIILSGIDELERRAAPFNVFFLAKPIQHSVLLAIVECYCAP